MRNIFDRILQLTVRELLVQFLVNWDFGEGQKQVQVNSLPGL
jgi:hypothetical protein